MLSGCTRRLAVVSSAEEGHLRSGRAYCLAGVPSAERALERVCLPCGRTGALERMCLVFGRRVKC